MAEEKSSQLAKKGEETDRYSETLGLDILDIFVGPKMKHFRVHTKLLCSKAPCFDKMMSGGFKEAIENTVRMPEDDPDAFNLFVEWLYMGRLQPVNIDKHTTTGGPIFDRIKLYCFAEKHCLGDLMDYTMSSLMSNYTKYKKLPTFAAMTYAYQHTAAGSKLPFFVAHALRYIISDLSGVAYWPSEEIDRIMVDIEELMMDVLPLMRSDRQHEMVPWSPAYLQKCTFHMHEKGDACPYTELVP